LTQRDTASQLAADAASAHAAAAAYAARRQRRWFRVSLFSKAVFRAFIFSRRAEEAAMTSFNTLASAAERVTPRFCLPLPGCVLMRLLARAAAAAASRFRAADAAEDGYDISRPAAAYRRHMPRRQLRQSCRKRLAPRRVTNPPPPLSRASSFELPPSHFRALTPIAYVVQVHALCRLRCQFLIRFSSRRHFSRQQRRAPFLNSVARAFAPDVALVAAAPMRHLPAMSPRRHYGCFR